MEMYLPVYWQCLNNLRLDVTQEFWDLEFFNGIQKIRVCQSSCCQVSWLTRADDGGKEHTWRKTTGFPLWDKNCRGLGSEHHTCSEIVWTDPECLSRAGPTESNSLGSNPSKKCAFFFFSFSWGLKNHIPFFQRNFWSNKLNGHSCECFENCN